MSEEKNLEKALGIVIGDIEKTYGKGAIRDMETYVDIPRVSAGSIGLDIALGGGYPKGRIIEIYGPESSGKTTLAIHAMVEAQLENPNRAVAIVDAEHAFDPFYAENLGLDLKDKHFLISQPDNGEQALEITERLVRSNLFSIVVVDSVAALTPKAEIEGEMGDSKMGLQARLMSQALRKLTGIVSKSETIVIFINQLRDKIGVMFGCFDYDTRVVLSDNTTKKIGQIVNSGQTNLLVKTFDKNGICINKPITQVFKNSKIRVDEFWSFLVAKGRDNGKSQFRVTGNHLISTPSGDVPADILKEGDKVLTLQKKTLSSQSFQILLGGLYGDSHLKQKSSGYFKIIQCQHGEKQREYCKWKADLLGDVVKYDEKWNVWYSKPLLEFDKFQQRSKEWINKLDLLSLAIMYMDDGSLNKDRCSIYKKWDAKELQRLHNKIEELTGARGSIDVTYGRITYCTAQMRKFINSIAIYIPECMRYKVYEGCNIDYEQLNHISQNPIEILYPMPILKIEKSKKKSVKFDLEVQDTHHYLVDGVLVHNSPETTTGGNALKFYASVRMDIRRIGQEKDGEEVLANKVRVKIVKNKVAPPYRKAEFLIVFGVGIDKIAELIDIAVDQDIIKKSGSWFSYGETKLGQGASNVRGILEDNSELMFEIEEKVKDNLGLTE